MGTTKSNQTEIRQLTQNSNSTSSISIPIEYVRQLGWRKGQKLKLIRKGRQLLIRSAR